MIDKSTRGFAVALALVSAAPVVAGQKAEKIAITPESEKALIIIKAEAIAPPPTMASGFHLTLAPFDSAKQSLGGSIFGGRFTVLGKPKLFYDGYLVIDVKPGTYVVQEFSRQDRWALCYNGESRTFTVKPGQALYLGEFDSVGSLRELEMNAISTGRLSSSGALIHFFDNISPPRFAPVADGEIARVQAFVHARMPKTTSPVEAVEFGTGRFGTGSDLFGTNRVCGGYFRGSAKGD